MELLLSANARLTTLSLQAHAQTLLEQKQSEDSLTLSAQLADSEARSADSEARSLTLAQQLTDSRTQLGLSRQEAETSNAALQTFKASSAAQSLAYQQVIDSAAKLAKDAADSLKAERAKLLPWQIAGIGGGAVGVATLVYWIGHALKAW
jgi:hypothetical protein